ncbi:MAG: universal stress protein [Actinomycetota bacterium]|nr:universal stress protein [Actinomycetota bacterium]
MAAQLKRRLGLYAVFTVSIGAMIGSGIFVLPGLAFEVGGPAMIIAYFVAGLIVFPAALAQAEMATAMPRAGGAYLYIDMAMGPMMGTIAGLGVWLSLVFKSAFALDGLGLYVSLFTDIDVLVLGLSIGLGLLVINLVGIKESGRVQAVLVTAVLFLLFIFIGGGATYVESSFYHPFLVSGMDGLFATAALVFVSYAGVTKVASLAEEVAHPARTLPVAILTSLLIMMFVYPAVTYVMIGVTPPDVLAGDLTPLATASEYIFPGWMVTVVAIFGVLALASMANAGLLASSRYPFAMARRRLAPSGFAHVGKRSGTPTLSIIITGALLLALVAFLPVFELAKLASAFQALVLAMICLAQIAFRSSKLWWYRPKFHAPGYPIVPVVGVLACLLLITQLGIDAMLGAFGIIVFGLFWYFIYGRSRAIKENAFRESVRQQGMARLLQLIAEALEADRRKVAVVSSREGHDASVLEIARPMAGTAGPDMVRLLDPDEELEQKIDEYDPDLLISSVTDRELHQGEHLPADRDVALLTGAYPEEVKTIAVLGSGGPFDVLKICLAAKIAETEGASIRFVHVLDPSVSRMQVRGLEKFHQELDELVLAPTESMVIESEDLLSALTGAVEDTDLVIIGATRGRHFFTDLIDRIVARVDSPVLLVRVGDSDDSTTVRGLFDRYISSRLERSDAQHNG